MPYIINVYNFQVLSTLQRALLETEKTDLLYAALRLVMLNSIRGIPHYVGAFFLCTAIEIKIDGKTVWILNAIFMVVALNAAYKGVEWLHAIRYDFGIPAIVVTCFVVVFGRFDQHYISPLKKSLQIILFLTAFQFLDVMPMTGGLPVGRGETSHDIKMAAKLLEAETLLNTMGGVGCLLLCLFGGLIFFQLREENNLKRLAFLEKQNEEIRTLAKLKDMENRTFQEVQHLVHDLKSPLTAMQTLVGLLKMRAQADARESDIAYLARVENGIELIGTMISEILYEDSHTLTLTQEIQNVVLAQLSVMSYSEYIITENEIPQMAVCVNRFLFPRAIINLIQNSANAIPADVVPNIHLKIYQRECRQQSYVCFSVSDNGCGIAKDKQEEIWGRNVSGTNSSGLGLAFVSNVVQRLGGRIEMDSCVNFGTTIRLLIPTEKDDAQCRR